MPPPLNSYDRWPAWTTIAEYDDALAVQAYLNYYRHHRWFPESMLRTELESRCLSLGDDYRKNQIIKKDPMGTGTCTPKILQAIQQSEKEWNSDVNADVRAILGNTHDPDELRKVLYAFCESVRQRIDQLMEVPECIPINRCPACSRVVRTPIAKQCMWCKHDWH